jgi:hypothetical protein
MAIPFASDESATMIETTLTSSRAATLPVGAQKDYRTPGLISGTSEARALSPLFPLLH